MDVQSSDGHGLLLKYVSSYVTKAHDAYHSHCLYDVHTTPYQAAYRHLKGMAPLNVAFFVFQENCMDAPSLKEVFCSFTSDS
jgi:hypothetical protein